MKEKILSIVILLFWIGIFGYLFYLGYHAVTIISIVLLGLTIALTANNEE